MRITSRTGIFFSLVGLGVSALVACGGNDTTDTATSATTATTTTTAGQGGAATTAGQGGATTAGQGGAATTAGQGGATTGAGGDATTGAGGSMGQGGGGGSMPVPPKQAFFFWGDYATDGVKEIALLPFPGMASKIPVPGVTKIDQVYEIAQSHDGTKLAFALRADGGYPKIYVGNADGSGMPMVVADLTGSANTAANIELTNVTWSPDGKSIAYRADAATNAQHLIAVVPSDGSAAAKPKVVSPVTLATQDSAASIAWVDNMHLAFAGDFQTSNVVNLFITDVTVAVPGLTAVVDGAKLNTTTKTVKTGVQVGADGKIYFRSSHDTAKTYLYRADADGKNLTAVPAAASVMAEVYNFALSPDGMSVAFAANEKADGLLQVYVAKTADMTATKLTAFTTAPASGKFAGPSTATNAIAWRPDGKLLAVIADWPLAVTDADDDYVPFVIPTSGNPAPVRIANVTTAAMNMDVDQLAFSADSARLAILGDLLVNNDSELYTTTDFAKADQKPADIRTQGVVKNGDIDGMSVLR